MKVRIADLSLIGTSRRISLQPGLNVITGPITTGKTTVLRLARALLGSGIEPSRFPREVREHVRALAGNALLTNHLYGIVRPFVSTPTAKVDIAGTARAWRLPAMQLDETATITYIRWLLQVLGLPELRVRSAPTQAESETTPVTINDYLMYCYLSQEDIDKSVFGADDAFKDIKRRYVFQIIYGLYNAEVAQLEERLRQVLSDQRQLLSQTRAFERFLAGTPFENRADVVRELEQARAAVAEIELESVAAAQQAAPNDSASGTTMLTRRLQELDREHALLIERITEERASAEQLGRLMNQLEAQSARLTRSIVAQDTLVDFEFVVCPRCGTPLGPVRGDDQHCLLCLQIPQGPRVDREALIGEQDRIGAQVLETRDLVIGHQEAAQNTEHHLGELERQRAALSSELEFQLRSFISDSAADIARRAADRAARQSDVRRLEDYLGLYAKLDQALGDASRLAEERDELEVALEVARSRQEDAEARIQHLEQEFLTVLERFDIPRFGGPLTAAIDRRTYLPIVNGRRWSELSSAGLQVLVNVAHALAHQRTALALGLPLPQILLIDGLTSNVGHEGLDAQRVGNVYDYLIEQSREVGDALQIIVADNDVPPQAEEYVRLRLSEEDRLIPLDNGAIAAAG